jgi:TonB family protein
MKVEMPSDPAALLALGAKKNGLQNVGPEPLHVKATYQVFDDKGGVKETGTFEEWRVSATKYKLIYASPSFNQTTYATESGLFRVGGSKWPEGPAATAQNLLYPTFPWGEWLNSSKLGLIDRKAGTDTLKCVNLDSKKSLHPVHESVYCFEPTAPILRIEESFNGIRQTLYNDIVSAHGAYIPRDAIYYQLGKPQVRLHLDFLTAVPHMDESILTPPTDAIAMPRLISVGSGVMVGKILRKGAPEYPAIAKAARIQGTVLLQAIIGKDGKVADLRTIGGPPMLLQAAMDSVRSWEFQPFLLDGEPVEVETDINVVFSLGG